MVLKTCCFVYRVRGRGAMFRLHAEHDRAWRANCRQAAEETNMLSTLGPGELIVMALTFIAIVGFAVAGVRLLGSRRR